MKVFFNTILGGDGTSRVTLPPTPCTLSLWRGGRERSSAAPLPVLPLSRIKNTDDDDDTQYVR